MILTATSIYFYNVILKDVKLLSYNTFYTGNHVFTCQHGKDECLNDLYQVCILNKIQDQKIQLELINCLMGSRDPHSKAAECMKNAGGKYFN